jgi:hypothetical protein
VRLEGLDQLKKKSDTNNNISIIFNKSYNRRRPCSLYCCEVIRISYYVDSRFTDGPEVVSPTHRPRSTPHKHFFFAFGSHFC